MNDESPTIDVNKRQLLKQNFENSFHLNKRNNGKMCTGLGCGEYNQFDVDKQSNSEDDKCPGMSAWSVKIWFTLPPLRIEKVNSKRKSKFKRSHGYRSTPRESILQAKIDILKDNYKRSLQSKMQKKGDSRFIVTLIYIDFP